MCDSPVEPALSKVADLFHQETNNQVTLACNPGPAIKKRIEDGEVADVVVVEPDFVEELTNSGKVRAGERPMIGRVGVGLGNRIDSPAYDISTVEKFKNTLLGADLIVFNSVKSGEAFAAVLERLGVAELVRSMTRSVRRRGRASSVAAAADLRGCQEAKELAAGCVEGALLGFGLAMGE